MEIFLFIIIYLLAPFILILISIGFMMLFEKYDEEFDKMEEDFDEIDLCKNKRRSIRRKNNWKKAVRKRNISDKILCIDSKVWSDKQRYNNLHQYSKNKIHCPCPECRFRSYLHPKQRTYSDMKKDIRDEQKINEYEEGEL